MLQTFIWPEFLLLHNLIWILLRYFVGCNKQRLQLITIKKNRIKKCSKTNAMWSNMGHWTLPGKQIRINSASQHSVMMTHLGLCHMLLCPCKSCLISWLKTIRTRHRLSHELMTDNSWIKLKMYTLSLRKMTPTSTTSRPPLRQTKRCSLTILSH